MAESCHLALKGQTGQGLLLGPSLGSLRAQPPPWPTSQNRWGAAARPFCSKANGHRWREALWPSGGTGERDSADLRSPGQPKKSRFHDGQRRLPPPGRSEEEAFGSVALLLTLPIPRLASDPSLVPHSQPHSAT